MLRPSAIAFALVLALLAAGCAATSTLTPAPTPVPTAPASTGPTAGTTTPPSAQTTGQPTATLATPARPTEAPTIGASVSPQPTAPDIPAGQIVFGRVTVFDPNYGPVAALYALERDGTIRQLTQGGSAFPAWSPDGTLLAYSTQLSDGTWQVATMKMDGTDVKILTSGAFSEVPSWTPDGSRIVYDRSDVGFDSSSFHTALYRMNADGSNPELLGDPDAFDVEPRVSPDGKSVLFERITFPQGAQHNALMVRDIESGAERVIDAAGTFVEHGNWSPDGKWIVYDICACMDQALDNDQLELIAADGSGEPQVLVAGTSTTGGFKPWYSPDGSTILFGCVDDRGDSAACVINSDGTNVRVLVNDPDTLENFFTWGVSPPA